MSIRVPDWGSIVRARGFDLRSEVLLNGTYRHPVRAPRSTKFRAGKPLRGRTAPKRAGVRQLGLRKVSQKTGSLQGQPSRRISNRSAAVSRVFLQAGVGEGNLRPMTDKGAVYTNPVRGTISALLRPSPEKKSRSHIQVGRFHTAPAGSCQPPIP